MVKLNMKNAYRISITILLSLLVLSACTSRKFQRGYMADDKLVSAIKAQVDTKDSVKNMLGNPSSKSTFDGASWYYFSKKSEQLAFFKEKLTEIDILAVRFDEEDYVTKIDRYTLADHKVIDPVSKKTLTHGNQLSFFEELFGNIGQFGAGGPSNVQPGN